jgi:hypothetical protein
VVILGSKCLLAARTPGDDTVVTVRLSDVEGGTLVDLTQETFKKPEQAANHQKGGLVVWAGWRNAWRAEAVSVSGMGGESAIR